MFPIHLKTRFRSILQATFCFLYLGLITADPLHAAELSTDFPKPQPPLELAPRLGRPFGDNAVFQQNMSVPVWGWTLPRTAVHVTFGDQKHVTTSGPDGRFQVILNAMPADMLKSADRPCG